jgi:autotransporter-associated beta strand protein
VLSTRTWSGLGIDTNWTTAANWRQGLAPSANDDLVFPAGSLKRSNHNDFAPNTSFRSITFSGSDYTLSGNAITLGSKGISSTVAGSNIVSLPMVLSTKETINAVANANLGLSGVLSGAGGLTTVGPGTVLLSGNSDNTYTGTTSVDAGLLLLNKVTNVVAVPNDLVIGQDSTPAVVRLLADNQIPGTSVVSVIAAGQLDLSSHQITLGSLTMYGGRVTGSNRLILNGTVTAVSASSNNPATIDVSVSLGSAGATIYASGGPGSLDLVINSSISGPNNVGMILGGTGTVEFAGVDANTYTGTTSVNAGTLLLNKSVGVNALVGALSIGTGLPTFGTATVRLGASNQFGDGVPVTVKSFGALDLGFFEQPVGSLNMNGGTISNGLLILDGPLQATSVSLPSPYPSQPSQITANLNLGITTHTIDVTHGPASADLIISGQVSSSPGVGLIKTGAGTLQFAGSSSNLYNGPTLVMLGVLQLNKSNGFQSVIGSLEVGAPTAGAGPAVARLLRSNQILNTAAVTVNSSGRLDLNNLNDTIGALTMTGGRVTSGRGKLTLNGDLVATSAGANAPARISGRLSLGTTSRVGDRLVTVVQGSNAPDLIIDAAISGPKGVTFTKEGTGTLQFAGSSSNTFTGATRVYAGLLQLNKSGGAQAVTGSLIVGNGAGSENADQVRLLGPNQIANDATVVVNYTGLLDLNNQNDSIGPLTMNAGNVKTGTGLLTLKGDVVAQPSADGLFPAIISGRISANGASRTFTVSTANVSQGADESDLVIEGNLSARKGLIKTGNGVLLIEGANPSPVMAFVNEGTLWIDGNQPATNVFLNAGTLQGQGTLGGILAAGTAPETVRLGTQDTFGVFVVGNLDLGPTTTLEMKMDADATLPGTDLDQLIVACGVGLNDAALTLTLFPSFIVPAPETSYRIINDTGNLPVSGVFGNLISSDQLLHVPIGGNKSATFQANYAAGRKGTSVDLIFKGVVGGS